ncbi:hypothetical protein LJK87_08290 [Paenibacillus sp. P25]|nr:hypothetical protein LJK87_08290 [Paenibacillus sp. P25]
MDLIKESSGRRPIVIVGGTGKTGRRLAQRLAGRGLAVRIGSRSGNPPFDWENRATWAPLLQNAGAVYVTYAPDLAVPGAPEAIGAFSRLAVEQGVRRVVLLSGRGEEGALLSEQALRDSGADWTILRASWFCQNFSESFLLDQVLSGTVALPVTDVTEPFIDAEDIADAAAEVLSGSGHIGHVYELTGPRALTFAEATEAIARASGRDIRYLSLSSAQFASALSQQGLPAEVLALMTELFTVVLDGRNSGITDGVQRVLGRKPRDFSEYAKITAAAGVWEGDE